MPIGIVAYAFTLLWDNLYRNSCISFDVIFCAIHLQSLNEIASQYYSRKGYWKGSGVIKKLAAKVSEDVAQQWLIKQALAQIFLSPRYAPRPKFDVPTNTQRRPPS